MLEKKSASTTDSRNAELNGSEMLSAGWTELLLNTEGITDVAAVLLESFHINRKFDSFSDLAVLLGRILIDKIPTSVDILYCIGDDFSLTVIPGRD